MLYELGAFAGPLFTFWGKFRDMGICTETRSDHAAIRALADAAFALMRFSEGTEGAAIDRMRADENLTLSLVA